MAGASIPVDLFNPGQVFACLGFLEAADILLGDAEGGFDWSGEANVRFRLRAGSDENPFAVVLQFLAEAEIWRLAPSGYGPPSKKSGSAEEVDEDEAWPGTPDLIFVEWFPQREVDRMTLPIRLRDVRGRVIDLCHWADGSGRNDFKLYSGNRDAASIACAMLRGTRAKPTTVGIHGLWHEQDDDLIARPFDVLPPMGGSFNFDPRGAWTSIDVGYSPNDQDHWIVASPVVELLAALGLEHARPDEYETRQVRYGAWSGFVPPMVARPALAGTSIGLPVRRFRFTLDMSGKNKVVTFAREETST